MSQVLNEFTREQIEGIYPALSPIMIQALCEELELMGYLEIKSGRVSVPKKGKDKLKSFRKNLTKQEKRALNM